MKGFILSAVPFFVCSLAFAKPDCQELRKILLQAEQAEAAQKSIADKARVKLEIWDKGLTAVPALILKQQEHNQAVALRVLESGVSDLSKLRAILQKVVDTNSVRALIPIDVSDQFKTMGLHSSEHFKLFYLGSPVQYQPPEYYIAVIRMLLNKSDDNLRRFIVERMSDMHQQELDSLELRLKDFDRRMWFFAQLGKSLTLDGKCKAQEHDQFECSAVSVEPAIATQLFKVVDVQRQYFSAQTDGWIQTSRITFLHESLERSCKE